MIGLIACLILPVLGFYLRDPWVWTATACLWLSYGACFAGTMWRRKERFRPSWAVLSPLTLAGAGLLQLAWKTTANRDATCSELWLWIALTVLLLAAQTILRDPDNLERFLQCTLIFGTGVAVLSLVQFYTSNGLIYWIIPTDQAQVYKVHRRTT